MQQNGNDIYMKLVHVAAYVGQLDLLKFFNRRRCSLNSKTGVCKIRPIHCAIVGCRETILRHLVSLECDGVDVNATMTAFQNGCQRMFTPLMLTVKDGHLDIVRLFLLTSRTVDINTRLKRRPYNIDSAMSMAIYVKSGAMVLDAGSTSTIQEEDAAIVLKQTYIMKQILANKFEDVPREQYDIR
jgi:hypothetical protein